MQTTTTTCSNLNLSLPPELFAEIFPFHLVFNQERKILQVGKVLQQIYPELALGKQLEQQFRIVRPSIQFDFDAIRQRSRSLFMLESLSNGMKLKGQMVYVEHQEAMFFLCSPWVTDIASLKTFGLTLSQFAIHDPVVDFLFLLQAQNTALADAKKLTDQLTQQQIQLRKTNRNLAALYAVTHILTEVATFNEAIAKVLASICTVLDWQIGVLWLVDKQTNVLRCQQIWTDRAERFTQFESIAQKLTWMPGVGLPGIAWQTSESVWVEDISTDDNSPYLTHAIAAGLRGSFSLPLESGTELFGVLEFFSYKTCQPDDSLLEMMSDIGLEIGQFAGRKSTEAALIKQTEISESLRSILDSMGDAVIVTDEDKNCLVFNPAAERMFGTHPANLVTHYHSSQLELYLSDGVTPFHPKQMPWARSIQGEEVNNVEMFVRQAPGTNGIWVMATGRPLKNKNGLLKGGVIVCRDITERKRVEQQLLHDALHDELTGLANRALFTDRLERAIARANREENYLFAVLFLDLDRFKVINDSLGHIVGDQLLIAIARRLETCLRSDDLIARLGGDEFAILLEDFKDTNYATQVAQRVQNELMQPFYLDGHEIFAATSIGIAFSTNGYQLPQELLRDADTAMYHAKALGKSRYQIFDTAMHIRAVALLQLETDLRRALQRHEFQVHYQPIVSLQNQKLSGFEALLRWNHPERGLISPAEFIPVAEETGLIIPLGEWVLREACHQMQIWQDKFPAATDLTISVNISGKQFSQPNLVKQIGNILQQTGLDPRNLKLEITESRFMENMESTVAMLLELKALGIQLSMDDFGTGYSCLSYLNRFPINTLKIDRSFISSVDTDAEKLEIIRTVVMLAWNLGMDVVAEGIETAEQFSQLKTLKCESGQGYFFSKPLDSTSAQNLLATEFAGVIGELGESQNIA